VKIGTGKLLQVWGKQMVPASHSMKMESYIKRNIEKMGVWHHHGKTMLNVGNNVSSPLLITSSHQVVKGGKSEED